MMLTTQAEYRLELPKRFGLVAFFGVGEVAPEIGAFNNKDLKPGGGAGVRFTVAKKNHVNLRIDYAAGLQGGGVYMGVSEAF
jgi:outer membrane translocation and assembly module TamA